MGSRVRASVLAIACVVALGLSATAAKAGLLDGLGGILDQILDGGTEIDPDLGDELADLLCDPSTDLAAANRVAPSALPADVIPALTCNLGLLDYKFHTTFKRADGTELVRTHSALVQVPRPLNVDDDIAPDLIGTIGLSGVGRFTLRVDRFLGENAALPMEVEAIISAPSGVDIGRDTIAFGYDTTTSSAQDVLLRDQPPEPDRPGRPRDQLPDRRHRRRGEPGADRRALRLGPGRRAPQPDAGARRDDAGAGHHHRDRRSRQSAPRDADYLHRRKLDVLGQSQRRRRASTDIDRYRRASREITVTYLNEGKVPRTITYAASDPIDRIDVTYTETMERRSTRRRWSRSPICRRASSSTRPGRSPPT